MKRARSLAEKNGFIIALNLIVYNFHWIESMEKKNSKNFYNIYQIIDR